MANEPQSTRIILRSTALCGLVVALILPLCAHAFNPNEGAEEAPVKRSRATLPSTAPLLDPMPKLVFSPITSSPAVAPRQVPVENAASSTTPAASVASTSTQPAPTGATTTAYVKPVFPPVDAAVAQRAAAEMNAAQAPATQTAVIAAPPNFAAPAPLAATSNPAPAAAAIPAKASMPEPLATAPIAAEPTTGPAPALTPASRSILGAIPAKIDAQKAPSSGKLAIQRTSPDIQSLVGRDAKIESYDAVGLSIKVARPGLDTNYELNRAYTSLMGGDTEQAIATYKNVLTTEPSNQDALFGLAATYHRLGDLEHARPYYGRGGAGYACGTASRGKPRRRRRTRPSARRTARKRGFAVD
jgi:hypothetical protein